VRHVLYYMVSQWVKNVPQRSICESVDWIHWKLKDLEAGCCNEFSLCN